MQHSQTLVDRQILSLGTHCVLLVGDPRLRIQLPSRGKFKHTIGSCQEAQSLNCPPDTEYFLCSSMFCRPTVAVPARELTVQIFAF
jgi:hypothetical protein